ncbi:IclR family transcriptional regulator [Aeromicrobium sp.]|uniref:IclR family transcriptional regulator n=1 Tax=Aeromicrobium sp. TaxID=1871063 RepID=UPI0019BF3E0E|nr:IclR family transcriptional regulator [Aeromicrobium sp.]MBC7629920.1 IclR family transcriptional regulator [Aeromicrobium sp.]
MQETRPHVVTRVGALLRAVGACEPGGGSTTQLASLAGLARPTTHRLLMSLAEQGMVDRSATSGRWWLGPELYLLGNAAAARYDITGQARDIVHSLARETGESTFLSARRGDESVCLLREDGSFPLRSHVLHEGIRFPLGVASAGLVMLAHLDDREVDSYLARVDLGPRWGEAHAEAGLRERIAATRLTGWAVNPALLVEGSWGMGAAVFDADGRPAWALSLTGVETRFRPERHDELGALLLDQAHRLTQRLSR